MRKPSVCLSVCSFAFHAKTAEFIKKLQEETNPKEFAKIKWAHLYCPPRPFGGH